MSITRCWCVDFVGIVFLLGRSRGWCVVIVDPGLEGKRGLKFGAGAVFGGRDSSSDNFCGDGTVSGGYTVGGDTVVTGTLVGSSATLGSGCTYGMGVGTWDCSGIGCTLGDVAASVIGGGSVALFSI